MKLRILGCDGGRGLGDDGRIYNNTTLLLNDCVLIDAGSVTQQISMAEAVNVSDIFFSHCHLDHIIDLPFMLDNGFEKKDKPLVLHGSDFTLDNLMTHIFNDRLWPNFKNLPTPEKGQFTLAPIQEGETQEAGGLKFKPFSVNHTVPTYGYVISDDESSIIFSADTGPTDELWKIANQTEILKAVIMDLSFPNEMQHIADVSGHNTAEDATKELNKLEKDCDVYVFHFKVGCEDKLKEELAHVSHFNKPVRALRDFTEIEF